MSNRITTRTLQNLKPKDKPYFVRSTNGFGVKVNPSGSIRFIVEIRKDGKSYRRTIGVYPVMKLKEAKEKGLDLLRTIDKGNSGKVTLSILLSSYLSKVSLKPRTIKDYRTAIECYLSDWLSLRVDKITKSMVEQRFILLRDKGWNGGKPTYSQSTKVMRILSALLNYAMGDELIQNNPVDILKQKKIKRGIIKRNNYLTQEEASQLLSSLSSRFIVDLVISMILHTGLRKNECLRLQWSDIEEDKIRIRDTKNKREHLIPLTKKILSSMPERTKSPYVFPSPAGGHYKDLRKALKRLQKPEGIPSFTLHDLRRTFATRASEVGIDYLMIKRLLNHKVSDITAQYIQWNSKKNLQKMKEALEAIVY